MYVIIMIDPKDLGYISLASDESGYTLTFESRDVAFAWIEIEKEKADSWPCHQITKLRGIK